MIVACNLPAKQAELKQEPKREGVLRGDPSRKEDKMKPEKKYKAGSITASIWNNQATQGSYKTILLERTYKDKDGNWKSTSSMRITDIPKAQLVLSKAYEDLVMEEAQ